MERWECIAGLLSMQKFMVSIVIPMYNGELTIEKTVLSCIKQTYVDLEIIITDDCSSDNSIKIVEKMAEKNDKIKVIRNSENAGLCKNANIGIAHAAGQFLLMLGQDDMLAENHIEEMLKQFDEDVVMVYCNCSLIDENDNIYEQCKWNGRELTVNDFIRNNAISSCGAMLRKECVDRFEGYPVFVEYPNYGEWYLWVELSTLGRIVPCNSVLALYRRHKNNISNTFNDKSKLIILNHYSNRCRKLAIRYANMSHLKKISGYIYILLKSLQTRLKYIF